MILISIIYIILLFGRLCLRVGWKGRRRLMSYRYVSLIFYILYIIFFLVCREGGREGGKESCD